MPHLLAQSKRSSWLFWLTILDNITFSEGFTSWKNFRGNYPSIKLCMFLPRENASYKMIDVIISICFSFSRNCSWTAVSNISVQRLQQTWTTNQWSTASYECNNTTLSVRADIRGQFYLDLFGVASIFACLFVFKKAISFLFVGLRYINFFRLAIGKTQIW